jgi:hypothetical protein
MTVSIREEMTMRMKIGSISIAVLLLSVRLLGQQPPEIPFQVSVRVAQKQPAPALQSFTWATDNGMWLLIGGRTNGFHRTSTREATFPSANSNPDIYVVDVAGGRAWKAPIPDAFLYQLRATNIEYYQDGGVLYLIGGYGSNCDDDKPECYRTFPSLTAIRVPELMRAIMAGQKDLTSYIVSVTDERMRVTGGELRKLGDYFYLVFGQDFEGIYKGGLTGKYTEQVRRFKINFAGNNLSVTNYQAFDPTDGGGIGSQYHRRDLNVVDAIRTDLTPGLTAYGGVFTKDASAWTNPINIDQDSSGTSKITIDTSFSQKMSQYSCAHMLAFWPGRQRTMYTTLFGGISFYYFDEKGKLVGSDLDNFLPFIDSITTLAKLRDGRTVEWPQPPSQALPELMGANAVFIPNPKFPLMPGSADVLNFENLPAGSTLVGYLYGGIHALGAQISFINPSYASNTIYEVYVTRVGP